MGGFKKREKQYGLSFENNPFRRKIKEQVDEKVYDNDRENQEDGNVYENNANHGSEFFDIITFFISKGIPSFFGKVE